MSEVETTFDRISYVSDVISEWAEEHDAAFLARENEIVWWYSITGDPVDYEWHRCSPVELARLIKVSRLTHEYMGTITSDLIISSFQESGRAYIQGVRSARDVRGEYFNYLANQIVKGDTHYTIAFKAIKYLQTQRINILWMPMKTFLHELWEEEGLDQISEIMANKFMRDACKELKVTAYQGAKRKKHAGKQYNCIYNKRWVPKSDLTAELSDELKDGIRECIK